MFFHSPEGEHGEWVRLIRDKYFFKDCYGNEISFQEIVAELEKLSHEDLFSPSEETSQKLYRAYVLMHPYAESNWEMFE